MLENPVPRELVNTEELLLKFVTDVAQGFYDWDELCERYGFVNRAVLFHFLRTTPSLEKLIHRQKTAYDSNENVEQRIRLKAGLSVENAIPHIAHLITQTSTPIGQKLDCFHKLLRAAGTDGAPPAPRFGDSGGSGPTFTLNFIWSDGTKENVLTARPSPPVIEHEEGM